MRRHLTLTAALLVSVSVLVGCASRPITVRVPVEVPITVYETVPVPGALLMPCEVSLADLETNQNLEFVLAAAVLELKRCTSDKDAIRALSEKAQN